MYFRIYYFGYSVNFYVIKLSRWFKYFLHRAKYDFLDFSCDNFSLDDLAEGLVVSFADFFLIGGVVNT